MSKYTQTVTLAATWVLCIGLAACAQAQTLQTQGTSTQGTSAQSAAPRWTAELGVLSGAVSLDGGGTAVLGTERQVYRLDAAGQVQWQAALGDIGRAFPALRPDGSLLVAAYDDRLYALGAAGQTLWSVRLDGDIFASPALLPDGSAVVATAGGSLYRIGAGGEVLWQKRLGSPSFSSPAVSHDGHIYLGSQAGTVFAFGADGEALWQFQAGRSVFSSPALDAAGNVYVGSADHSLYSLSPAGELRWRQTLAGFVNASPIVTTGGLVVVGSYGGDLNAYALDSGTPAWSYAVGAPVAAAATELWNGNLLVGDLSGVLHQVSRTGGEVSRRDLGERIDTPVTVTDDGTWLVTADGKLEAFAGGWPQAAGPWSSFRSTPQGWGRALTEAEQAPLLARRQQAAAPLELAQAQAQAQEQSQPQLLQPTPLVNEPLVAQAGVPEMVSTPTTPSAETAPAPASASAAVTAPTAEAETGQATAPIPRLIGGRVHLPLPELARVYTLQLVQTPAAEGQRPQVTLTQGERNWSLPTVLVDGVPYASIGDLGRQPDVQVRTSAQGLEVLWAGQTQLWPLDWVKLYANPLPSQ